MRPLTGVAAEWCAREYGGRYQSVETRPIVGTSRTKVLNNNPERVMAFIQNLDANPAYLSIGASGDSGTGMLLPQSGGNFSCNLLNDLVLPTYEFQVEGGSASTQLLVIEVFRYALDDSGVATDAT